MIAILNSVIGEKKEKEHIPTLMKVMHSAHNLNKESTCLNTPTHPSSQCLTKKEKVL